MGAQQCGSDDGTATDEAAADVVDYRFTLANERTFLAWIRTSLGLLAGGVALQSLAAQFATADYRRAIALSCAVLALVLCCLAFRQWRRVNRAMHQGTELPGNLVVPLVAVGVVLIAIAAVLALVLS